MKNKILKGVGSVYKLSSTNVEEKKNKYDLKALGSRVQCDFSYNPSVLEAFPNRQKSPQLVRLTCNEFTSLCPITGQPDFAKITINYIPNQKVVETKALKLYLCSFRNYGCFQETITDIIMQDLINLLDPLYIEVSSEFSSRGGIAITPFSNYAKRGSVYEDMERSRKLSYLQK